MTREYSHHLEIKKYIFFLIKIKFANFLYRQSLM